MNPVIQITEKSKPLSGETALTVGKFDGVHTGHQRLLDAVLAEKKNGYLACMVSFCAGQEDGRSVIYTKEEQRRLCGTFGIDVLAEYTLNEALRGLSAERFVKEILCEKLNVKVIVAGEDFRFGKGREGNVEFLRSLEKTYGYRTVCIPKVENEGVRISSTKIKEFLSAGNMEEANAFLGSPYFIYAEVVHGKHLGRTIGFPTINVLPSAEKLLPAYGVYATQTEIGGTWYSGITNVGVRPTVDSGDAVSVETHLLGYEGELYGTKLETRFLRFLRPEQKFESVEALKDAIQKDMKEVLKHSQRIERDIRGGQAWEYRC